jgi:hypothetical protein
MAVRANAAAAGGGKGKGKADAPGALEALAELLGMGEDEAAAALLRMLPTELDALCRRYCGEEAQGAA